MVYDLRRLRLHGIVAKIPKSHRYRVTPEGMRIAVFLLRAHSRLLRPGSAAIADHAPSARNELTRAIQTLDHALERAWRDAA
jgi:hypothetical protein